jgi:hypothetical protein
MDASRHARGSHMSSVKGAGQAIEAAAAAGEEEEVEC